VAVLGHAHKKTVFETFQGPELIRARTKNTFLSQAALRLGFEWCTVVPFLSLGARWGKYEFTFQDQTGATSPLLHPQTFSKNLTGFMPGVGVMWPMGKKIKLSLEYNVSKLGDVTKKFTEGRGVPVELKQKVLLHTLTLGVNWMF
jgi:opacity protein-like surface antigen